MQSVRSFGRIGRWGFVGAVLALSSAQGCGCNEGLGETGAMIEANPNPLGFGAVAVGSFAEQFVSISNAGRGFLTVTDIVVAEGPADQLAITRVFTTDCEGAARTGDPSTLMMIDPGGCARFVVRFGPSVDGPLSAKIRVSSNASDSPELEIPVTGSAVKAVLKVCVLTADGTEDPSACSDLSSDPAKIPTLDFGPVALGQTVERTVRVYNDGSGDLKLTEGYLDTEYVDDLALKDGTVTATVASGQTTDVVVVFTPQGDDDPTGDLVLPTNDLKQPLLKVPVKGDGRGPKLCVDPVDGLDFGDLAVGAQRELTVTLSNCGPVDFDVKKLLFVENDTNELDYTVPVARLTSTSQPLIHLAAGDRWEVPVTYRPTRPNRTDTGYFSLETTYQRGTVPVTGNATPGTCAAGDTPIARITASPGLTVQPLDTVTLSGTTSTSPNGNRLSYQWTLKSQPPNGTVTISPVSSVSKQLFAELAGDYVVELVVKDTVMLCQSAPATVTVQAKPQGSLHVQLTWPQSFGDVDLHLLAPNGTFYNATNDCHWQNCKSTGNPPRPTLLWGGGANRWGNDNIPANDPRLDIDALWGNGPENINIDLPFDGTYKIVASYYCDTDYTGFRPSNPTIAARVRVYLNGNLGLDVTKNLSQSNVWEVANVVVAGGQITATALTTPIRQTSGSLQSCR